MRNLKVLLSFVLAITLFCSIVVYRADGQTTSPQVERDTAPPITNIPDLVDGNTDFAFKLYHEIVSEHEGNLIFSPYSISMAFSMLYAGARDETATQIADTLDFTLPPEELYSAFNALDLALQPPKWGSSTPLPDDSFLPAENFTLNISNSIWGQTGFPFEEAYLQILVRNYGANLHQVDFSVSLAAARQAIKQWIEEATSGRIKDVPPPDAITPETRLALLNAIYFKGEWTHPFNEIKTHNGKFHLENGTEFSVPMMVGDIPDLKCARGDNYYAIQLPYGYSESAAMLILMPDSGEFQKFEAILDAETFQNAVATFEIANMLTLTLPRFKFESEINLQQTLTAMGMTLPFDSQADFTGISSEGDLTLNYASHKATIAVDEQGTEASGVTMDVMLLLQLSATCDDQDHLTVDRPFIFAIYDRYTSAILFLGRVMNPAM